MTLNRSLKACFLALSCALLISAASIAGEISDTIFLIEAEAAGVAASFDVPFTSGNIDGDRLSWSLAKPLPLESNGVVIGTLEQASVQYVADPVVVLNFLVSSGGAAANFTVTSANLSFASIGNAEGRASAELTVTDFGGDGATMTGNFPNNDTYRAFYNDPGNVSATGTTFATLTPGIVSSPFSGATSSEGFPDNTGGFSTTNEAGGAISPVSSMSAQWKFSVSQFDSASGTSVFVIQAVPEPGSMLISVLGMALLGLIRRR